MTGTEIPAEAKTSQLLGGRESSADLSVLDKSGDRVARGLRQIITGFGLTPPEFGKGAVRVEAFDQWRAVLPPVAGLCRFALPPFKAGVVVVLPARLIAQLVDGFYGGSGDIRFDRAVFTGAEERILNRVGEQIAEALGAAWADAGPVAATLVETGSDTEAPLFSASEQLAIQTFPLEGPNFGGLAVEFLYPIAGIRAIRPISGAPVPAEPAHGDTVWQDQLIDAVLQVRLPLRTIFARAELPLSDLLSLRPGDLIPICLPDRIPVTVSDRHFAEGTVGESNGRVSVRIETMQKGPCNYD